MLAARRLARSSGGQQCAPCSVELQKVQKRATFSRTTNAFLKPGRRAEEAERKWGLAPEDEGSVAPGVLGTCVAGPEGHGRRGHGDGGIVAFRVEFLCLGREHAQVVHKRVREESTEA